MLDGLARAGALGEFVRVMADKKSERELWQMYLVAPRDVSVPEFLDQVVPKPPCEEPNRQELIAQTLAIAGAPFSEGGESA